MLKKNKILNAKTWMSDLSVIFTRRMKTSLRKSKLYSRGEQKKDVCITQVKQNLRDRTIIIEFSSFHMILPALVLLRNGQGAAAQGLEMTRDQGLGFPIQLYLEQQTFFLIYIIDRHSKYNFIWKINTADLEKLNPLIIKNLKAQNGICQGHSSNIHKI